MEIGILTSSRADFGFYKPLIRALEKETKINVELIVFGTHLSKEHGYTVSEIKESGFTIHQEIATPILGNKPEDIVKIIGEVHIQFADFWKDSKFDLIICLGDRYEMFAAISATVPFNLTVAHISGGEQTLGAIDDIYRNTMTLIAKYHFTNTEKNAHRVEQIIGTNRNVYYTGSLAIDNIKETAILSQTDFLTKFKFDLSKEFVLFTFHPETVNYTNNKEYATILKDTLLAINKPILVTMPNADTMGNIIREKLIEANQSNDKVHIVESLGSVGYYTALTYAEYVLGNSSSGIVEAASFGKYVINLGERQAGREYGENIIHSKISKQEILNNINRLSSHKALGDRNIYGDGNSAAKMVNMLLKERETILRNY